VADTIVTLSGDDAKLYQAFQRIIDQQAKTDAGYGKLKESSKKAAAEAAAAAKEQAKAEAAAAKAAADRQRADVAAAKATQREIREVEKAYRDQAAAAKQSDNATLSGVQSLGGMAAAYVSVSSAIKLVTDANQIFVDQQNAALAASNKIAAAQQEAAKNLAGTAPEQITETLTKTIPEIAKATSFSDLATLTTATGAVQSITGDETQTRSVVQAAAQVTRLTPGEIAKTATATADLLKATGLKTGQEGLALLASTGSVARPEQLAKLATGAASVASSAIGAAPGQDSVEAAKEGIALYAKLSAVDPEGSSSATATGTFIGQISELFSTATRGKLRTDIEDLQAAGPTTDLEIERRKLAIRDADERKKRFQPGTVDYLEQEAKSATAANEIKKLETKRQRDAAELAAKQAQETATAIDPGNFAGRLAAVQSSPELRDAYLSTMTGEQKFKPLFTQLTDSQSKISQEFQAARGTITTEPAAFEAVAKSVSSTPQMALANMQAGADTSLNVLATFDRDGALRAGIADTVSKTLSATSIDWVTAAGTLFEKPMRAGSQSIATTSGFVTEQRESIQDRLSYLIGERNLRGGTGDAGRAFGDSSNLDAKIEALAAVALELKALAELPGTLKTIADQGNNAETYQKEQNRLTGNLEKLLQKTANQPPTPAAINAQQTAAKEK
jgi:trimeric autotransporter adhesin